MGDWFEHRLVDVGRIVTGKTPPTSNPEFYGDEVLFVTPSDMDGRRTIDQTARKLSSKGVAKVKSSHINESAVIVSCIGSDMGKAAIVSSPFVSNQQINSIVVNENFDMRFVYYNLSGRKEEIQFKASGAAQPIMNKTDFGNLTFRAPCLADQISISSVLGALDDKIELNRQTNETLEAMGRALFRDWFVDFGPTRAKMESRTPYLPADLWSLFPDTIDDETGTPVGWTQKTLGDYGLELESGRRPKGGIDKTLVNGVPSVGAESIYGLGRFDYSKLKFVSEEFSQSTLSGWVQAYDVAIYKDGANVGDPNRVALFGAGFPFENFMVNEHVFLLRSKQLGQCFLFFLMQSQQVSDRLEKLGKSKAAQPGLNQGEVKSCGFVSPGQTLCQAFNEIVMPWIELGLHNGIESQKISQTRDLLLPKLMSGEIGLRESDQIAGQVL